MTTTARCVPAGSGKTVVKVIEAPAARFPSAHRIPPPLMLAQVTGREKLLNWSGPTPGMLSTSTRLDSACAPVFVIWPL